MIVVVLLLLLLLPIIIMTTIIMIMIVIYIAGRSCAFGCGAAIVENGKWMAHMG